MNDLATKINPLLDGVEHINIYSQGKTELGRMLSNFARFPMHTYDGDFMSVEGYWYWLGIEECTEKEQLRKLYGFNAKKTGKALLEHKATRHDDEFEKKILNAIWRKFKRNANLILPEYRELPFEHYYNFSGCVRNVKDKYPWMIDGIDQMRAYLLKAHKNNI